MSYTLKDWVEEHCSSITIGEFKRKPFDKQMEVLKKSAGKRLFAFFLDMGTGKTKVSTDNAWILFENNLIDKVLIACPAGVLPNWEDFSEDIPDRIPYQLAEINEKKDSFVIKKRFNIGKIEPERILTILVLSISGFLWTRAACSQVRKKYVEKFVDDRCLVILDESTKIKATKAKTSKHFKKSTMNAGFKRLLTGFPMPNSIVDLFSQMDWLDWRIIGERSEWAFRLNYCVMQRGFGNGGREFFKNVGIKNEPLLKQRLIPYSATIELSDVASLDEKNYNIVKVSQTLMQKLHWDNLRKKGTTEIEGVQITPENVLGIVTKLHQLSSNFIIKNGSEGTFAELSSENHKWNAFLKIVKNHPNDKIIVWVPFKALESMVKSRLEKQFGKESFVNYFETRSPITKAIAIERFKTTDAKFFLANPASGGMGLTLTNANVAVYWANARRAESRVQSEQRIYRAGQRKPCYYYDLVTENMLDQHVLKALHAKKNFGMSFIRELKIFNDDLISNF